MRVEFLALNVVFALSASAMVAKATPYAGQTPNQVSAAGEAAGQHYSTATTDIGTLLDDPAAKAVLQKHIPAIVNSNQIDQARSLTLKAIQQYAPDQLSDKVLAEIDEDLARLPPKH